MEAAERSSSIDLSSVPGSDTEPPPASLSNIMNNGNANNSVQNPYMSTFQTSGARQDPGPAKKPRKPKVTKPKTDSDTAKPARKPRASNGSAPSSRKKPKTEHTDDRSTIQEVPPSVGLQASRLVEPYTFSSQHAGPGQPPHPSEAAKTSQNGLSHHSPQMHYQPPVPQPQSRTTSMYDPIRGSITVQESVQPTPTPQITHTPPRPVSRSGASPISSLIEPTVPLTTAPSPLRLFSTPSEPQPVHAEPREKVPAVQNLNAVMEVDGANEASTSRKASVSKEPPKPPTRAASPKPARAKEKPPPLPAGNGLLSATVFGGGDPLSLFDKNDTATTGPNIVLRVDLKNPKNQIINFARTAEEKYGFAALYPRQAAQKARLERVAAAGAALERSASGSKANSAGESGDDDAASVDIDRDTDNDGDVAMGGTNGLAEGASGTDAEPKKKVTRRKKVEEYDLDDDFVDDSEQVWEAQAATSKEGFFVYCGPLVPDGEKATIERADGTVKNPRGGRGRGRGGGPGSRGGRGARATAGAAARDANATSNADSERPKTGPGSRGGKINRRPRVTKPAAAEDKPALPKAEPVPATSAPMEQQQVQQVPLHV
ncbi:Histone promoter control protein 2 [Cyphellophora attinorum]|uniref:Histone promoter control protein 2 n=1 Tax=Cyphellophora attinorum TaxID=1664694 RepID=A0A0N1HKJ0_9EURO|nr:Histone promoter control protein 2 [Phialophora attinorum]KPI34787.1 Histone promoter control protein 2 [Phialophora attinorum]